MTLDYKDDVVIKILTVDRDGKKLEIQKIKAMGNTTVNYLR